MGFLQRCLDQLAAQGYGDVITSALAPAEQDAFFAVGFYEHERLRLLSHNLAELPDVDAANLRPAREADRSQVLALDEAAFPPFWRLDDSGLQEAIAATRQARFRVAGDGTVVGYAVCGRTRAQGYVQRLAVHPERRRRGTGRALVVDGLRWMRRRGVERAVVNTQLGNDAALRLYLSLGFREEPWGLSVLRRPIGTGRADG